MCGVLNLGVKESWEIALDCSSLQKTGGVGVGGVCLTRLDLTGLEIQFRI